MFADDADARSTNALANAVLRSLDVEAEFDTGYGALGALGWRVLPAEELGPRFEVERNLIQAAAAASSRRRIISSRLGIAV